ncbi:hypothetical protein EUX98_g7861 [Antrodiella citrinella]|uniref:Up-regulated during septation protein 1 domain-containing protein n=1 Tax=Antrodiella citrinella TaxID=2447956 RepID=A0A4S4ML16_9APHY|nr:hypothetical protein EUX98_g7861 [Antrodiella citrinella]
MSNAQTLLDAQSLFDLPNSAAPPSLAAKEILQLRFDELQLSTRIKDVLHQAHLADMRLAIANLTRQIDQVKQCCTAGEASNQRTLLCFDRLEAAREEEHFLQQIEDATTNLAQAKTRLGLRERKLVVLHRGIHKLAQGNKPPITLLTLGHVDGIVFPSRV